MSEHTDIERVLERWFDDGPTRMPDRVVTVVADRIDRERQRRPWRLPWRFSAMSNPIKLVAAGAALLAVLLGGTVLLSAGGAGPGPAASPTPAATASPTTSPAGRVTGMQVQGASILWKATVPAGRTGAGSSRLIASQGYAGPTGLSVGASRAVNVPSDPCDGVGKASDGASVADVVAMLQARDDLVVSDPIDTTLGGYQGQRVDVEMPADLSACGDGYYLLFAEPDGSGTPALGPSNRFRVWILDVEGRPIAFWIGSFAGTPPDDAAAAQRIVDSIVITP